MIKKFLKRKFKPNRFRKVNRFRNSNKFKRLYKFSQFRLIPKKRLRKTFSVGALFPVSRFLSKKLILPPKLDQYRLETKTPLQSQLLTFAQEHKLVKILGHMDAPYQLNMDKHKFARYSAQILDSSHSAREAGPGFWLSFDSKIQLALPLGFFFMTNNPRWDYLASINRHSWINYAYLIKDSFKLKVANFSVWKDINFYISSRKDFFQAFDEFAYNSTRPKFKYRYIPKLSKVSAYVSGYHHFFDFYDWRKRTTLLWVSNDSFYTPSFYINSYEKVNILSPRFFFKWRGLVKTIRNYHKSWYLFNEAWGYSDKHNWLFLLFEIMIVNCTKIFLKSRVNKPWFQHSKFISKSNSVKTKFLNLDRYLFMEKYKIKLDYWLQRVPALNSSRVFSRASFVNMYLWSHGFLKMQIRRFMRKKRRRRRRKYIKRKRFICSLSVGYRNILKLKRGSKKWRLRWDRRWVRYWYPLKSRVRNEFLKFSTLFLRVVSKLTLTYFNLSYFFFEKNFVKLFFLQFSNYLYKIFSLRKIYQRFCTRYLGSVNKYFSRQLLCRFKGASMLIERRHNI